MDGEASYTDPEVIKAFEMWKECLDKGYFNDDPNAYDWAEAATMVGTGEAAMTLMGTGSCNWMSRSAGMQAKTTISSHSRWSIRQLQIVLSGPIDGVVLAKEAAAKEAGKVVLAKLAEVGPSNRV